MSAFDPLSSEELLKAAVFEIWSPPMRLTLDGAGVTAMSIAYVPARAGYFAVITAVWHRKVAGEATPRWVIATTGETLYRSEVDSGSNASPTAINLRANEALLTAKISGTATWCVVQGGICGYYVKEQA